MPIRWAHLKLPISPEFAPMDLKDDFVLLWIMEGLNEITEQCLSELREGKAREILERHNDKYISG